MDENYARGWNAVDDVLDRLRPCEYVTLVVRPEEWMETGKLGKMIEKYFPSMWERKRVVLEVPPPPRGTWLGQVY